MTYRDLAMSLTLGAGLVLTVGCFEDGTTETGANDSSGSASDTGQTTTGSTSASTTMTSAPTGGGSVGSTAGMESTAGETEATTSVAETTAGVTTDGATDGTTTGGGPCVGLDEAACNADPGCMPISGSPIEEGGAGACIGPMQYIECQPTIGCGDAITYACEGDDAQIFEFLDTCIPAGWIECPPPPVELLPC